MLLGTFSGRPERREMATARVELVKVLGPVHAPQAMPAEVDPRVVGIQRPARIAGNDLPSVRGSCDARRHVDCHSDIVTVDEECLARMRPHPDPERERPTMVTDRSLGHDRCARRGGCRLEGTEKAVPFTPDYDAASIIDRRGDDGPHLAEHIGVGAVTQLAQKSRGLLDIGEEKRDGADRQPAGAATRARLLRAARRIEVRTALDHSASGSRSAPAVGRG